MSRVQQFVGRWERAREERQLQRQVAMMDPRVRDEYLEALAHSRRA